MVRWWMVLFFVVESCDCDRVVVTFVNATLNERAVIPTNATVVKRYGKRLVMDAQYTDDELYLHFEPGSVVDIEHDLAAFSSGLFPQLESQWNLNESEPYGLHIGALRAFTNGSAVVAVLDGGLPEVARLAFGPTAGYSFITANHETRSPDFTDMGNCTSAEWHGTNVVSVLEAVAPGSKLIVLRVLDACGMGFASDIADAIVWSAGGHINGMSDNPTPSNVLSMSFVGEGVCPSYLQSAITQATGLGSVIVAAAGNEAMNASLFFPGNCKGVLVLGASTRKGTLAAYSNWGDLLAFSAPGGDTQDPIPVLTVLHGALTPTFAMGSSLAAPHASGLFSLLIGAGIPLKEAVNYFPFVKNPECGWMGVLGGMNQSFGRFNRTFNFTETAAVFAVDTTPCPPGTSGLPGGCVGCPARSFSSVAGASVCTGCTSQATLACSIGTQFIDCTVTGDSYCQVCPIVPFCTYIDATCTCRCVPGYGKVNGVCQPCATGYYNGDVGDICFPLSNPTCAASQFLLAGTRFANSVCKDCSALINLPNNNTHWLNVPGCGWSCNAGFYNNLP